MRINFLTYVPRHQKQTRDQIKGISYGGELEPLDHNLGQPRMLQVGCQSVSTVPCKTGLSIVLCYARNFG
jgi:hypothetical protein